MVLSHYVDSGARGPRPVGGTPGHHKRTGPRNPLRTPKDGAGAWAGIPSERLSAHTSTMDDDQFSTPNCPRRLVRLEVAGTEEYPYLLCPSCRVAYLSQRGDRLTLVQKIPTQPSAEWGSSYRFRPRPGRLPTSSA
jgi:hypothetical protein